MLSNTKYILITVCAASIAVLALYFGVFKAPEVLEKIKPQTAQTVAASGTAFAPHKALYEIKLASTKSGSQVVNISGQMFYEWQPTCEAWATNHRFNMLYEYADTPPLRITSDFTTFEAFDGSSLNFSSQRKKEGEVFEALRGRAEMESGKEGLSVFSIPEGLEHTLPAGTLFPMHHTAQVAQKIEQGQKFFSAVIYDGSDEDGPVEVNTFIGEPVNALSLMEGRETHNLDTGLINTRARKVRLAFFPLNAPETTSDYEMELVFHDNGVISDMLIEYEDFSVTQRLVALERLESNCEETDHPNE